MTKRSDIAKLSTWSSQKATVQGLLNCLVREFAFPLGAVEYTLPRDMIDFVEEQNRKKDETPLYIRLPGERQFLVMVDRCDVLGSQRYLSDVMVKIDNGHWYAPSFTELIEHILKACGNISGHYNDELAEQIFQSQALVKLILEHNLSGHQHAPEFQASTRLYQFEVPLDGLCIRSDRLEPGQVLAGFADQSRARPGHGIIVMHPVQAWLFMQDDRVRHQLELGRIIDLGASGYQASPTASIRTWYLPGHDYFIKGSLNIRITNCVRKNDWYEFESTLIIARLLHHLITTSSESLGGFLTAPEPGKLIWCPPQANEEDRNWFREQTGAILRENFCLRFGEENCLLAGTLFSRGADLHPLIQNLFQKVSGEDSDDEQLLMWFSEYQRLLLSPVLSLFFNHGVVLEPHLQNSVVVHINGWPEHVLLRDFEGVKLTEDLGIYQVDADIHPRIHQSLLYSREQGWNRICYCLFVKNLAEAVLALSWSRPWLAPRMWQQVRTELIYNLLFWLQTLAIQVNMRAIIDTLAECYMLRAETLWQIMREELNFLINDIDFDTAVCDMIRYQLFEAPSWPQKLLLTPMIERAGGPGSMPFGKGEVVNPFLRLKNKCEQ